MPTSVNQESKDVLAEESKDVLAEETNESEVGAVKLPKCKNHWFHRNCIAQWVKLKGYCPFCKAKI